MGLALAAGSRCVYVAASNAERELFSPDPIDREAVVLDEDWSAASVSAIVDVIHSSEAPVGRGTAEVSTEAEGWWADYPQTGESVYETFVVNPSRVDGKDLIRNSVLNPGDLVPPRELVDAFLGFYGDRLILVGQSRDLLNQGRARLATELAARGQIQPLTIDSIADHSFALPSARVVSGQRLLEMMRKSLGSNLNERSVVSTALSIAGLFDVGDAIHVSGGSTYLVPFSRIEEGIPTILSLDRSVTLDTIVSVHYWFAAFGVLPNADELILLVVPKIMEEPR